MKTYLSMSSLALIAGVLAASPGFAQDVTIPLDCSWDLPGPQPVGGPHYQVVKTSKKSKKSGKWKSSYSLVSKPMNPGSAASVYKLKPALEGDEDYNDYDVVDAEKSTAITGVAIQNEFHWANLQIDGVASFSCVK
jgi:hypothetical protein